MADEPNADIRRRINALVEEQHRLRAGDGGGSERERRERLDELETELDRAWDLLRQREARREFDQDPSRAHERSARMVENYES